MSVARAQQVLVYLYAITIIVIVVFDESTRTHTMAV